MPIKFKPSQTVRARGETKSTTTHYYITNISEKELNDSLANDHTPAKKKQKIRNELVRRNVKFYSEQL